MNVLTETPPSQASQLPHFDLHRPGDLLLAKNGAYSSAVVHMATRVWRLDRNNACKSTCSFAGLFVRVKLLYGGCTRETFGSAGFALFHRFANLRTAATHSFGDV
ncbi:hypothetical protein [Pseudomonas antarctica]|nr:hypothetical protein [Pseudomonas antarctica]